MILSVSQTLAALSLSALTITLPQTVQPLNVGEAVSQPASAVQASRELRETMLRIQSKFYRADGSMEYGKLEGSTEWKQLRNAAAGLRHVDPSQLKTRSERLAFWINLYNALVVDGVIHFRVSKSVNDRRDFFRRAAYDVGGRLFSLEDIEHGILRGNRPPASGARAPFGTDDPRRSVSIDRVDARIHFALNCGARACPLVRVYDAEKIDGQLDSATRSFVNGPDVQIDARKRQASISRIFEWYAVDFGPEKADILRFIARYLSDPEQRKYLEDHSGKTTIRFLPYDWSLNAAR